MRPRPCAHGRAQFLRVNGHTLSQWGRFHDYDGFRKVVSLGKQRSGMMGWGAMGVALSPGSKFTDSRYHRSQYIPFPHIHWASSNG
jgi:hypothetical protein